MIIPPQKPRMFSVKNTSTETVPPFGLMALAVDPGGTACQEEDDGLVTWHIKKPDADAEVRQDPFLLFINRAIPIPAGKYGVGFQNWPTRVLLEGGSIDDGVPVGPVDDEWSASEEGEAFVLLSNDHVDDAANTAFDLGWVSPCLGREIWGKLDDDLNAGSNATVSVYRGDPLADTTVNVEVYDPGLITTGQVIEQDCYVWARWYSGKYHLFAASCCPVTQ